jgi:hypothetical protein
VVLIGSVQATEKENQMMADNLSMALAELLRKADAEPDVDTLCEGVRVMTQALMELQRRIVGEAQSLTTIRHAAHPSPGRGGLANK